ncbi:MAG: hypothetical protein J0L63_19530 [Anaerolineae bacterium]|nr:hypothetical protein [Anaerolineae bacterium]
MSAPVSRVPAAFHRHAAAAAAANLSASGISVFIPRQGSGRRPVRSLPLVTCHNTANANAAIPATSPHQLAQNRENRPAGKSLSAPSSLIPAAFIVGASDDDDDKRPLRRKPRLLPALFDHRAAAAAAAKKQDGARRPVITSASLTAYLTCCQAVWISVSCAFIARSKAS